MSGLQTGKFVDVKIFGEALIRILFMAIHKGRQLYDDFVRDHVDRSSYEETDYVHRRASLRKRYPLSHAHHGKDENFVPFDETVNLREKQEAAWYYEALNAKNKEKETPHNLFHEINPGDLVVIMDLDRAGQVVEKLMLVCCVYTSWDKTTGLYDYPSAMGVIITPEGAALFPETVYYGCIEHVDAFNGSASILRFAHRIQLDIDDIFALLKKFDWIHEKSKGQDLVDLKPDFATSTNIGMMHSYFYFICRTFSCYFFFSKLLGVSGNGHTVSHQGQN